MAFADKMLESLEELRKYANGEYKEADLSDNEREMRIHLEYENRIWGIMRLFTQHDNPEPARSIGTCEHGIEWQGKVLCHNTDECEYQRVAVGPIPYVLCTREEKALAVAEAAEESRRGK